MKDGKSKNYIVKETQIKKQKEKEVWKNNILIKKALILLYVLYVF